MKNKNKNAATKEYLNEYNEKEIPKMKDKSRGKEYLNNYDEVPKPDHKLNRYFGAVIDVESSYGTMEEIANNVDVENYRYFNEKFVDTPEKALAVACDIHNVRHKQPYAMEDIMAEVKYDPIENEYVFTTWETRDYHRPTEKQWNRFHNGDPNFRLLRLIYRIQVYETHLVPRNLIPDATNLEFVVSGR